MKRMSSREGRVLRVLDERRGLQLAEVRLSGGTEGRAVNYPDLTGSIGAGDRVLLNTTAVEMSLGTGGCHFVHCILSGSGGRGWRATGPGHIMKLRYTPQQIKCLSGEEEDSPLHEDLVEADSLSGAPVVILPLHSMLVPAVAGAFYRGVDVVYVMTEGGALPLAFSENVHLLRERGYLGTTVTAGHSFGGDYEAVNLYSALLIAHLVQPGGLIVVGPGPGIAGTGTRFGNTGIEQGQVVNAVATLGGDALAVPRISFAEGRGRHRFLSHHTVTALGRVALVPARIPLPRLEGDKMEVLHRILRKEGLAERHRLLYARGEPVLERLAGEGFALRTMGRDVGREREFFLTAAAGGLCGARLR